MLEISTLRISLFEYIVFSLEIEISSVSVKLKTPRVCTEMLEKMQVHKEA